MHDIRRNLLYEVKKQANKRADPFLNPNSEDDDIRAENQRLRTKIRAQDTQIIRLNGKIDELNQKLILNATKYRTQQSNRESSIKQAVNQFSAVPMLLQNKELKQSNQILHQQNLVLNGKNNELQAQLRQLKSDKYSLELRIKQFNILQKMRQQRFRDQVDRLTPIIISEPSQYTAVKNSIRFLTGFLRQKIVDVLDNLFILGVKQCQSNKKLNSYTVFKNYWKELQSRKNYGYMAATSSYSAVRKVMRIIDEKYGEIDLDQGQISGTLDQWVMHSVIEIKSVANAEGPEQLRKLFRLLALKYRCKFPIKGQTCDLNQQVKAYLDHEICLQAIKLLSPKKNQNQLKQNENATLNKFK